MDFKFRCLDNITLFEEENDVKTLVTEYVRKQNENVSATLKKNSQHDFIC